MKQIYNDLIEIAANEENGNIVLHDKQRDMIWRLENPLYIEVQNNEAKRSREDLKIKSVNVNNNCIEVIYQSDVVYNYILHDNFIEIECICENADSRIKSVAMPSSLNPSGEIKKYIFPIMQGMLWNTSEKTALPFESRKGEAGHGGFAMPMFAVLGDNGGMIYIAETQDDCHWLIARDADGGSRCENIQTASLGTMRYNRVGRIYFTEPSITKAAKCYKARIVEKGRFVTFKEKIKKTPSIKNLFGALMCYIGYCQDDIDYVESFRKLKAYGFDRALVYPVRFNTYTQDFKMGGNDPINLSDSEIAAIKALGYDVAPWSWINEGIDDGSEYINGIYRNNHKGEKNLTWQIDDFKYYNVCTAFMKDFYISQKKSNIRDMTWDHFDVITCATNSECHAKNHEAHMGRALSKTEDREYIRQLLLCAREHTGAISSESFNDAYSKEYDIGSVKALPQYDAFLFKPIPFTMLVYHDSMIHSWWEVHNYNSKYFGGNFFPFYQYGGGRYELMATMDALYGSPPDVFPFGAQYGWTGNGKETMLYRFRFEDPEVQHALKIALPVAKSHEKVGMLEMTEFDFLSGNYNFQRTVFEDGTSIYANFGLTPMNHSECGSLPPLSWAYGNKKY